ncbi:MAG TPA: nucleotidyltransferase family protein [Gemmatimonadaceae bacterium]|nr:nucleotidyltransferase family protein [Gemmatimonadaceae bacterium]
MKLPIPDSFTNRSRMPAAQREGRAIFRLARPRVDVAHVAFAPRMDWSRLIRIAWDEGAICSLRDHLRFAPADVVPLDVKRRVAFLALQCDLRMRALARCADTTLAALAAAGIEVVLLKGAALAMTSYGSFAARPMNDIDLLVEPGRAEEAREILLDAGWMLNTALPGDSEYGTHHHLPPLVDAGGHGLRLEIHRELLPPGHPFRMTTADIWREVRTVRVGSTVANVLHHTQHALHVAIHFAWSHAMRVGGWHAFRDLGALQAAGLLDWEELVQFALRTRASSCCYWTLRLGQELAGLDVPAGVLDTLAPSHGTAMSRMLERHWIATLTRQLEHPVSLRLERALWTMSLEPQRLEHGESRPWTVSSDLAAARLSTAPPEHAKLRDHIAKLGRSSVHLGSLIRT